MFGFIAGLITANAGEWYIHKYWLHQKGKQKDSFWRFHWAIHHKTVMQENFKDSDYNKIGGHLGIHKVKKPRL
ncbi:MAG: hypothetical protein IPN09_04130 [Bacteroidetes bacterium]|nr:hypothetical protein [Bacteroidota bacterium]